MTEINKKNDLSVIPPTNNDGDPYVLPLDIFKEGYTAYNISNWFKGRVGDNGTPFAIRWYSHGRLLNILGMRPFIEGQIGDYTIDDSDPDNPQINMAEDASHVHIVGDVNDTQEGGLAIYRLISQAFPKSGIFYGKIGFMGTQDDGTLVNTGVDIVFKVLAGHMNMLGARKFYVSELEKAWLDLQAKFKGYDKEYNAKLDQELTDLRAKILNEVQRAEDTLGDTQAAIDNNIAGLKKLAAEIASLQVKIETEDLITESQYNTDRKYIVNLVETQLANLSNSIEYLPNADAIKDKYPNGEKVFAVAADTGHKWIYYDGKWQDCGAYDGNDFDNNVVAGYGSLFWDDKHTPEKYQDLNTLEINRIYGYSQFVPKNAPTNSFNGFVIDQSYQATGIELQIAVDVNSHNIYFRTNWGGTNAWPNSWDCLSNSERTLTSYGILFWDDKHTPEKYQDLNTVDSNKIYGYSQFVPKNAPTNSFNGFIWDMTYQANVGLRLQFAIDTNSNTLSFRTNWGGKGFNSWVSLPDKKNSLMSYPQLFWDDKHTPEKYQDLNTIEPNRIYGYSGFVPKNAPVSNFNGQVISFSFDPAQNSLVTQLAHLENAPINGKNNFVNQWYERHSWGTSALNFSAWKRIDSFNGFKSYGELFFSQESCPDDLKDLNSLPQNTIFGFDKVGDLKHSVPGLNFNGLIYNLSYTQEKNQPFVQYAICKDDYGPIIAYRNNWSNKISPWIIDNKPVDFYVDAKNQTTDSQHFTKLVDAMWATHNTQHPVVIHIAAGTYDMYQEFGGETFLKKLDLHTNADDFKTEMPMLSNVTIIGEGNVKLNYLPDLNTAEKYPHAASIISPINVAGKFEMQNVDIEVQYGRYCIHDETSGDSANFYKSHKYINVNCIYHQSLADSIGGQAFGGGFDNGQSYLFQNCSFESGAKAGLSFHNRDSCGGSFIFDNCFFSGKDWSVRFGNVGKQTKSKAKFSSCYFAQKIYVNVEALSIESTNAYALTLNNCNATAIDFDSNLKEQSYQPKIYNALGSVDKTVSPTPTANNQPTSGTTPATPQPTTPQAQPTEPKQ